MQHYIKIRAQNVIKQGYIQRPFQGKRSNSNIRLLSDSDFCDSQPTVGFQWISVAWLWRVNIFNRLKIPNLLINRNISV